MLEHMTLRRALRDIYITFLVGDTQWSLKGPINYSRILVQESYGHIFWRILK